MLTGSLSPETVYWLAALWSGLVGAAVGSFLNVIIYRLPAGMNIAWPGSHCPQCRHPIRWFDNLPVLSWILLRGRCRDCRGPISIRYPLVEAGVAALFVTLSVAEVLSGGANLPVRPLAPGGGALLPDRSLAQLSAICTCHLLMLCTLLAAALMAADGKRPPRRSFLPVLLVGLAAPAAWPWLHPVHAWPALSDRPLTGLMDGLSGLVAGAVLGGLLAAIPPRPLRGQAFVLGAASVGAVLGWHAAIPVVGLAALAYALARLTAPRRLVIDRIPALAWLAAAALAWILAWTHLVPGP
ncbi:MAG: prepilin peptidase [Thermoguttaceae bacterium]|jgi:prepilin signal peptidase PulO-like enzyme (type II secretory pathway)